MGGGSINEIVTVITNGAKFSILESSHRIINILLENDFAEKKDNLLISPYDLIIPVDSINIKDKNKKIKEEYFVSNFYDTNLSATIILDSLDDDLPIYYSKLLDIDIEEYDVNKKRKKV